MAKRSSFLEQYVAEAFVRHELFGGAEHGVVDVRPHHLTILSDPLAEQSQPAHHPAPDVDGPDTATVADLGQEPAAAGLPHPGLELEPLQLGGLAGQQICRRTHDVSSFHPSLGFDSTVQVLGHPAKCTL